MCPIIADGLQPPFSGPGYYHYTWASFGGQVRSGSRAPGRPASMIRMIVSAALVRVRGWARICCQADAVMTADNWTLLEGFVATQPHRRRLYRCKAGALPLSYTPRSPRRCGRQPPKARRTPLSEYMTDQFIMRLPGMPLDEILGMPCALWWPNMGQFPDGGRRASWAALSSAGSSVERPAGGVPGVLGRPVHRAHSV